MAVYTDISEDQLRAFAATYALGDVLSFSGITEGVENSNFHLTTTAGRFVLTVYEKRVVPADLPFFLGLCAHLANKGIACPQPIPNKNGALFAEILPGKQAAIVSFLAGVWPRSIAVYHCAAVGKALAQLHLAGADFPLTRLNNLSVQGWYDLVIKCVPRAHEVAADLPDLLQREWQALASVWPDDLPRGVIHADMFQDNVFFNREQFCGVIDFYFACTDLWAYDLSICLNAWCFEPEGGLNITKARALIQGYETVRPLARDERKALPLLSRGSALRFLLTRLYDWLNPQPNALVRAKDPKEYLNKLRFHRQVSSVREYGCDD